MQKAIAEIHQLKQRLETLKKTAAEHELLKEQHAELQAVNLQQDRTIADLKCQHVETLASETQKLQASFRENLKAEQTKHAAATTALVEAQEEKLKEVTEDNKLTLERERSNHEQELTVIRKLHAEDMDRRNAQHKEKVAKLRHELEEKSKQLEQAKASQELDISDLMKVLMSANSDSASDCPIEPPSSRPDTPTATEAELKAALAECDTLRNELAGARADREQLKQRIKELEDQINREQPQIDQHISAQCEQLRLRIGQLETQIRNEQDLADRSRQNNEKELELARRDAESKAGRLRSLQEQLERAETKLATAEHDLGQLREELTDQKRQVSTAQQGEERLQKELTDQRRLLAVAEEKRRQLSDEVEEQRRRCTGAAEDTTAMQRRLAEAQEKEWQLQAKISELTERAKTRAKENDDRLAELNQRNEQLHKRLCEESDRKKAAEQKLQRESQELTRALATVDQQAQKLRELQESQVSTAEHLNAAVQRRNEAINLAQQLQQHVETEKRNANQRLAEVQQLKQANTGLQGKCIGLERSNAQLQAAERDLRAQLNEVQKQREQAQRTQKQTEETIREYQANLATFQTNFEKERAENERLVGECTRLQNSLNRQIAEAEQLQQQHQQPSQDVFFNKHRP